MLRDGRPAAKSTDQYLGSMRRTKIVATIGPASREPATLVRMVEAGMDVARLNYSHGTLEEHAETVERVRAAASQVGRPVAILQDLPGPKLRIGPMRDGVVELTPGEILTFVCGDEEQEGDARRMSISWAGLAEAVEPESILYLADGSVRLRVVEVRPGAHEVDVEIEVGGAVASRQGLNIPGPVASLPAVPEEDLQLLRHGESIGVDMVALSFVRTADDVRQLRDRMGGRPVTIVSKIEKPEAWENIESILDVTDGVMVARGDLGVEISLERVPVIQKSIIRRARRKGRFVITATQMLESMIANSTPTRAEVSDVANAIYDGTDAVMLSAETSVGKYPVEAARFMARIAAESEDAIRRKGFQDPPHLPEPQSA